MNLTFLLRSSFFGLNRDREALRKFRDLTLDEQYNTVKYLQMTYADVMTMPVYKRKYFLNKFIVEQARKDGRDDGKTSMNLKKFEEKSMRKFQE